MTDGDALRLKMKNLKNWAKAKSSIPRKPETQRRVLELCNRPVILVGIGPKVASFSLCVFQSFCTLGEKTR
jgi:hypothetical protein